MTNRNPWRVVGTNNLHADYSSQRLAYDAVAELTGFGHAAEVYHWEQGDWRLYERIEAAKEKADG